MTKLLEIKDILVRFYSNFYVYINIVLKFVVALVLFLTIKGSIGYMDRINTLPVILVLALICCLLPMNATIWIAGVVMVLNLYALAKEAAVVGLLLFLVLYFLYFRFCPKDNVVAILSPLFCKYGIPYVTPVISGLLRPVYSVISAICGTVVYYFIAGVRQSAPVLTSVANEETTMTQKLSVLVGLITDNKEMYAVILAMVASSVVIYFVRQLQVDYSWIIAIMAGVLLQVITMVVCCVALHVTPKVLGLVVGNIIAIVIGFVIQFFCRNLDYARVERVQYEDDEYAYYVKAVPKKIVAAKEKTVKQFGNTGKIPRTPQSTTGDTTVLDRKALAQELDIDEELLK